MAFIPAPNAIRICLQMEWTGQTVEICIGILKNAAVTTGDLAVVTTGMEAWRVAELRDYQSSDLAYKQWYALSLTTSTSRTRETALWVVLLTSCDCSTTFSSGSQLGQITSSILMRRATLPWCPFSRSSWSIHNPLCMLQIFIR